MCLGNVRSCVRLQITLLLLPFSAVEMDLKCANMINQMLFKEPKTARTEAKNHLCLKQQAMIIITRGVFFLFTRFVDKFASPFSVSNTKD